MIEEGLIRAVGVRGLTAAIINYTVGAGIFVLPAIVAAKVGAAAPVVYLICAVAMGLIVLCFADAGSRISLSGGVYAYTEVAFGQYVGFMVAVSLWFSTILASAAVANIFVDTLEQLAPAVNGSVTRGGIMIGLYGILAVINIRGVKIGSDVVQTVTAAKLAPILILIAVGLFAVNPSNLVWPGMPSAADTARTTVILIFAFMGIESALIPSGEVSNPARTVPRAIFIALAFVTLVYIAVQVVTQGILGAELATNTKAPLAAAAKRVLGRGGEILVVAGASISTLGYIAGDMLAAPRMIYALGRDALLPRLIGSVHERYRTPHIAIVIHAIMCAVLAISGTFAKLAVLVVLLTLLVYLGCCLATIQLQRRGIHEEGTIPFRVPGGPVIPILASGIIVWLMSSSTRQEFIAVAIMLVVASILFPLARVRRTVRVATAAVLVPALGLFAVTSRVSAQQAIDSSYTARIRELTPTDRIWKFNTDLVETMPASTTVPTPLKVLGYVPGSLGRLSYVADLNRYFRALAAASPRTKLYSLGMSDEGREMIVIVIADEPTIANIESYRTQLGRLADPRGLSPVDRARLIHEAKPIYWLSGSIHSPETGSPEMLMELAYRLAVDESENVRAIRSNVITMITPVTEVDGRDRMVDADKEARQLKLGAGGVPLIYWGKYTAHDNNRDGMVLSQKLTQNFMAGFLHWKPVVVHDLHESVPFLYTSTGTGPYNEEYDPIVVDEWHTLAYQEITELTRRGLPGIWTHGFYDGWAPNYTLLSVANLHNSIGRFYETYTSSGAGCRTVRLPAADTARRWDRPNPPVNGVRWCIRSNINFQESGSLIALRYVADHRETFLTNYVAKAERMIERGRNSAPYAFVIPRGQRHAAEAADMVNLFRAQGSEVHVATGDFTLKSVAIAGAARSGQTPDTVSPTAPATPATQTTKAAAPITVHAGDWIVRLDQPYSATVRTLLAIQKFKADDPPPYDDTGWTLDALRHVETIKVTDSTILTRPMQLLAQDAKVTGTASGTGTTLIVKHLGDWRSAALPWKLGTGAVSVAEANFSVGGASYPAGTFIIDNASSRTRDTVTGLGLNAVASGGKVAVRKHAIHLPRIALLHSWIETQNEGWVRYAFDQMGIPYTYISEQRLKQSGYLDKFDVIVYPNVSGPAIALINGRPMIGPPIPWKKTATTPNLDKWDETDDIRPGMGLDGLAALRAFVERGGLLLTTGNTSRLPVEMGFNGTVSIATTTRLNARGGIFRAQPVATASPVLYGYESGSFPVYFSQQPLFTVAARDTIVVEERDPVLDSAREKMRAKVILKFHDKADSLLVSGLLAAGDEMAGKAAVVDAPVGKGHVVLFGIRPLWRWESQGSFALALNAIANWNHLSF